MSKRASDKLRVSSPASTGGAGTFFEQHVGAHWLSLLLVRAMPPIIHDCTVVEVHFQTERLGWSTDDFLVVGENGSGARRKLLGQVKRSFTVSASDDECKKAILDFWQDFQNNPQFSAETDRFAIVTLRGTNTLLESFSGLLDCSRAARSGEEFEQRLATKGILNAKAVQYCEEIRKIIVEGNGTTVSTSDVWPFLAVLHVLSLDLNSATNQTEASIKNLLAFMTAEHDPIGVAGATWHALLAEVGEGMPSARSFTRNELPQAIRDRHSCLAGPEQRALGALADHSALVLSGIRSTIGHDFHLPRARLVQSVVDRLEADQVVLLSGTAGSGKSGVAKDAVESLAANHFVFAFRAEEFSRASLDESLHRSQIPVNAKKLGAILAGQARKVLLVESVERLLEASTRDAFTDLLTLVAEDKSWQLLLTCRDYSTDLVRASFLDCSRANDSVVMVPLLDDSELNEVRAAFPSLARPLSNASLRKLLRNPYTLDKARLISWPENKPLPESEREFRTLFWRDIVRVESRAGGGMPSRRERTFVEIALRRARALTLFAPCGDLDPAVTDALRFDSLVVQSQDSDDLFAPAHDVLEDWAILHWISEQCAGHDCSVMQLSNAIGTHPAVRRTYRNWVGELVDRDRIASDALFLAVLDRTSLPNHFCDDTLVAFLRSRNSADFLDRHCAALFSEGKFLLRRVIHLLRVACVTSVGSLGRTALATLFTVPDGPAWATVLGLVAGRLESFESDDHFLLLGIIEDWARGISWQSPYPEGAKSVSTIAHHLLPHFGSYRSDDPRKRVLTVLAKIPKMDKDQFAAILGGHKKDERRDRFADDLKAILLEGMGGMAACRDVPELVIAATKEHLLLTEVDIEEGRHYGSGSLSVEPLFGIQESRHMDYFPASAWRGPFFQLLRHHPRDGLGLLITVFNHSAEWYAQRKVYSEYVEPPFEMTLAFADGTTRKQWCNPRLWGLYRGTSVGPYVLQSALMAMELWLLEYADAFPSKLDSTLLEILRRGDSCALTAVVASVATAHPHIAGEALLVLLSSKECILLDRGRFSVETQAARLSRFVPVVDAMNKVYAEEREQANARPHRRHDLETAILNLQLGPCAGRVHAAIDRHLSELPPVNEQAEVDRMWRLALHRMDFRQYIVAKDQPQALIADQDEARNENEKNRVLLNLKAPEQDIQEMADQSATRFQALNKRLGLQMWGLKVFRREVDAQHDPIQWRARLTEAMAVEEPASTVPEFDPGRGGPGFVAAVCARDHWEELSDEEKEWCASILCSEIERSGDNWDPVARGQRNSMSSDRPAARVLPVLVEKQLPDTMRRRVTGALVIALTHPVDEVRWYAATGIGGHLWGAARDLALRCVNTLATEAVLAQEALDTELGKPYLDRRDFNQIESEITCRLRSRFFETDGISADALLKLDPTRSVAAEANGPILAILGEAPTEPAAIDAFRRVAQVLVDWWDADDDRRAHRRERNHETESAFKDLLEEFVFRVTPQEASSILKPILDAVQRHSREISFFLLGIITIEDRNPATVRFWELWRLFADRVRGANWLEGIDDEHSDGGELLTAVFLGSFWKEHVRHWRSLEGHAQHVHELFDDLPVSSTVMEDYLRFLYHVGEQSLPDAFLRIAKRLQGHDVGELLSGKNTIFMLETLLRRHVYTRPLELKRRSDLRDAVLHLLDSLVEVGSSAAFRMRDDFVTPIGSE